MAAGKHTATTTPATPDPPHVRRAHGRVQRVYRERGFGFIRCTEGADVGEDYFFHESGLDDCDIRALEEGSRVSFESHLVAKGRRAEHIQRAL